MENKNGWDIYDWRASAVGYKYHVISRVAISIHGYGGFANDISFSRGKGHHSSRVFDHEIASKGDSTREIDMGIFDNS